MASPLTRNAARLGIAIVLIVSAALLSSWLHASFERRAFDRVLGWFGLNTHSTADQMADAAAGGLAAVQAVGRAAVLGEPLVAGARDAAATAWDGRIAQTDAAAADAGLLDAAVVVGGIVQTASGGRIALPSGSRFQLRLRSDRNGVAEVFGISPDGRSSAEPLWSGPLRAGTDTLTPTMRLVGTRGVETLRVLVRSGNGGGSARTSSVIAERRVQVWHL